MGADHSAEEAGTSYWDVLIGDTSKVEVGPASVLGATGVALSMRFSGSRQMYCASTAIC
jgi:hypothetical protein